MYREGKKIEFSKRVLYMSLETTGLRGRLRNRWQDEVREDERIVGGEGWQEKVYNRAEWKKLLRMARNCRILHMPMEWMNVSETENKLCFNWGQFLFLSWVKHNALCSVKSSTLCVKMHKEYNCVLVEVRACSPTRLQERHCSNIELSFCYKNL